MKYVVILADGMSDHPLAELDGKTPMEYAKKPVMDSLAEKGRQFSVQTVPNTQKPGSDVANLSVLGYDPDKYYTGRSPIEAASIGVTLSENDMAFRANLVTLSGGGGYEELTMKDYSAGEISTEEAAALIEAIGAQLADDTYAFYAGTSYRHLMVRSFGTGVGELFPPHDILDKPIKNFLPTDRELLKLMKKSRDILLRHPVNTKRRSEGKNTADSIWLWGNGKAMSLPSFKGLHGISGAVISAVDLVKGLAILSGMEIICVEGATGNIDTNYDGKAAGALSALREGCDFVYVHIEAPDECGHQGQALLKAKAIELIDEKIVRPIKEGLESGGFEYKMLILPDHPTPVSMRTHTSESVPCLLYDSRAKMGGENTFTEKMAQGCLINPGHELMSYFIKD